MCRNIAFLHNISVITQMQLSNYRSIFNEIGNSEIKLYSKLLKECIEYQASLNLLEICQGETVITS